MEIIPNNGTGQVPVEQNQITPVRSLAELEDVVDKHKANFIQVGEALTEIKERKLYKPQAWAAYVQERFGFTRQYAHRLMQAMEWAKEMSTTVDIPQTEHAVQKARKAEALKRSMSKESKPASPMKPVRMPSSIPVPVQAAQPASSVPIMRTELADPKWGLPLNKSSVTEELNPDIEYNRFTNQADLWQNEFRSKDLIPLLEDVIKYCKDLIGGAGPDDDDEDEDCYFSSLTETEEAIAVL